jgi:phosphoglycerate dehydrogenase-like enzyme
VVNTTHSKNANEKRLDKDLPKRIILSTTDLNEQQRGELCSASPEYDVQISHDSDENGSCENAEIVLLSENAWLSADRVKQMSNLKFIQTLWAGVDSLNFEILPESVTVSGNVGGFSDPIAEHVIGLMLTLARNLREHEKALKQGKFDRTEKGVFLKGKKISILGTGGIGQSVARLAKAFGMTTLGVNTSGRPAEFFDRTVAMAELDSLLPEAEFVVIALPLTVHTRNTFDSRRLGLLKPGCILVNVGRGKIINERALYEFLRSHPDHKVATDVWWKYPKEGELFSQNFPFFELPNFTGTPHDADDVPESHDLAVNSAIRNIVRYIKNENPRGIARREDYLALRNLS